MTDYVKIKYRLTFDSAFHFGTGLRNGLIHRTVARDKDGFLYVPGSTLKGILRDRCEQLAKLFELTAIEPHHESSGLLESRYQDPDIVMRIFGSRFLPGQLYFDDAKMVKSPPDKQPENNSQRFIDKSYFDGERETGRYKARQVETRTQMSMSRQTGTAKAGHLYTSEYGMRWLRFEGEIYGHLTNFQLPQLTQVNYSLLLLLAGLSSLDHIGGNKSVGAGAVQVDIYNLLLNEQKIGKPLDILKQLADLEGYELERGENI